MHQKIKLEPCFFILDYDAYLQSPPVHRLDSILCYDVEQILRGLFLVARGHS